MRKIAVLVLVALCGFPAFALTATMQDQEKKPRVHSAEQARWHGIIIRSNKDESTFTVRRQNVEKPVQGSIR